MKKMIYLLFGLIFLNISFAQDVQRYENSRDESHLCGAFQIEDLEKDTIFQKWYNKNYLDFEVLNKKPTWVKDLKNVEVIVNVKRFNIDNISPNPATNLVTVNYKADEASSAYLMVLNSTATTSNNYILDVNQTPTTFNVSNFQQGVYSVILVCDGVAVDMKSLIVQ
jgi:hypothetical protein